MKVLNDILNSNMTMLQLECFILTVVVTMTTAENDQNYCGMAFTTNTFSGNSGDKAYAIHLSGPASTKTDIVEFTAGGVDINLLRGSSTGTFPQTRTVISTASSFCGGGSLFIADINADHFDDLLCLASGGGTFSYRLYHTDDAFHPEKSLTGFTCSQTVLIGDFDGNGADDIMCYDNSLDAIGSEASIYFNGNCLPDHEVSHGIGRDHRNHHNRPSHFDCRSSVYTFHDNAITNCLHSLDEYLIVADIFGDGLDDLVCHKIQDTISYYRASGSRTGEVFFDPVTKQFSTTICPITTVGPYTLFKLLAADVDGDKDDDIVCVNGMTAVGGNHYDISYFKQGAFADFQSPSPAANCIEELCHFTTAGTASVDYQVGDYNGDGFQDYMCQYDDAGVEINIVYSVPVIP